MIEQLEYGETRLFLLACSNENAGVVDGAWSFASLAARLVQVHVGASLSAKVRRWLFWGREKFWEVLRY